MPLLQVENLRVGVHTDAGSDVAVDGVSLHVGLGETLGIVGESGCGKSLTVMSIPRLLPQPAARVLSGHIYLDGRELLGLPEREMRKVRGRDIGVIFQDPMTALNPVLTVGDQICESLRVHEHLDRKAARARALDLLELVAVPDSVRRLSQFPHELSGGLRQRILIAAALACRPRLLIADEPTTALDVTIQAQILCLIKEIQIEFSLAVILVSHDIGVIAHFADRVMVMYAGQCAEEGTVQTVFEAPRHPYTNGLMNSVLSLDKDEACLAAIPGTVPALSAMPPGCSFAPRCQHVMPTCENSKPAPVEIEPRHKASCFLYTE